VLMQEMFASNKDSQSANQISSSSLGPVHRGSLNDDSSAANGAFQPNVPACKSVWLCICLYLCVRPYVTLL